MHFRFNKSTLLFYLLSCFIIIYLTAISTGNCFSKITLQPNNYSNINNETTVYWPWRRKKSRLGILNKPFFGNETSHSVIQLLKKIDTEKVVLDAARPLSKTTERMLHENIMLEWIYHSNAIEGSSMSWSETSIVLQGLTPKHKTHKEFYEVINHRDAIEYLVDLVRKNESLTEYEIRNIHSILLKNIDPEIAGSYRERDVIIFGAKTDPPESIHVPHLMNALINWYQQAGTMHPVERASILHTRFVMIHPFSDGNGRTGRLLMNLELMKYGYPPAVIQITDRPLYYDAIEDACASNNYDMIISQVAESVQKTLKVYLKYTNR